MAKPISAYTIKINFENNFDKRFILWLLNSTLLTFYYIKRFGTKKVDLFPEIQTYLYEQLPILLASESEQQPVIELVDQMLLAQKRLRETEFKDDKKTIEKQIEIIDGKIDDLVFDLYGLSEEERKVVLGI